MKQLAEYTTKKLYSEFKTKEICFVVAKSYKYVNELSYITDDMNDALSFAKENDYKIFSFNIIRSDVMNGLFKVKFT